MAELFKETDLFVSREQGYHTYRIPALIVFRDGTILAFCEARKYGGGDAGKIDIVLKRSPDYGRTWGICRLSFPVVDVATEKIWLPRPYEKLTFVNFNIEWLTGGADSL